MANNSRINPMYVDTASSSRLVSDTTRLNISGIVPIASNATWAIVLKDGAGNVVYQASNLVGVPAFPCLPFFTVGLIVDTLTACTALIYTVPSA